MVVGTIVGQGSKHLVRIPVDTDGDAGTKTATITATAGHPFWVAEHGGLVTRAEPHDQPERPGWTEATRLDPGDWLTTADGQQLHIETISSYTDTRTVYNLTIAGIHTYHIGAMSALVHNCAKTRPGKSFASKESQIANRLGCSRGEVKDAIHEIKDEAKIGGKNRNPDVVVDTETGDVYVQGGPADDPMANIFDYLPEE